ncbi:MAG: hypothetical protein EOR74_15200 [Mesorhizobium sp.]|nr:MAG: hypothetical protein EOR74_15200 [Mesorhizobium sp.]
MSGLPSSRSLKAVSKIGLPGVLSEAGLRFKLWRWTEQSRGRMAQIAKKTKRYPSDLTDEEW